MKKILVFALTAILVVMMVVPVSALDLYSNTVVNVFDELPAMYKNATTVNFGDFYEDAKTNAHHGEITGQLNDFNYVYLKADDLGDFTVPFKITEAGLYEFGFTVMGWTKSVLRSTNVRIDDSANVYMAYDYVEDDQYHNQYWTGISVVLEPGDHTMTLSLADDFDNENVKSLYYDNFFFVKGELPVAEPAVEDNTAVTLPATDDIAPVAPADPVTAPATFDIILGGMALLAISASGLAIFKKKK